MYLCIYIQPTQDLKHNPEPNPTVLSHAPRCRLQNTSKRNLADCVLAFAPVPTRFLGLARG